MGADGGDLERFFVNGGVRTSSSREEAIRTYYGQSLFLHSQADSGNRQSSTARGGLSYEGKRLSGNAMEGGA